MIVARHTFCGFDIKLHSTSDGFIVTRSERSSLASDWSKVSEFAFERAYAREAMDEFEANVDTPGAILPGRCFTITIHIADESHENRKMA